MVITLHYFNGGMGGGLRNVTYGTFNFYSMHYLESVSIIAVNCFVLVSGYFMVNKTQVKLIKAINLMVITTFYGIVFYILSVVLLADKSLNYQELLAAAIPFYNANWFVASYLVIFLLAPFLNKLLNNLSKKQFQQLIVILVISFSVLPTILPKLSYNDHGYGVLNFIMLYCIAAYIRLHYVSKINKWLYLGIYLVSTSFTYVVFNLDYNSIYNLISSVSLFLFFSTFSFSSKFINYLATFTFAVYIIHTNPSIRYILFQKILRCNQYWNSSLFLMHLIVSVIFIFVMGMVIEVIRRFIVYKLLGRVKLFDNITIGTK
jgi:surface polysaccharide O-acyltransferase-like enzyme